MSKNYFLFITIILFFYSSAVFSQQIPSNLREHLSLMQTGKIDSNYLKKDNSEFSVDLNWNIISDYSAYKIPPTGISTTYSMDLIKFDNCDWLVELSHEYQYDSKRLILKYYDGLSYHNVEIPYDTLFSVAKEKGYEKYLLFFSLESKPFYYSAFQQSGEVKIRIYCKSNKSQTELNLGYIFLNNCDYTLQFTD